jgi:LL-diaminopimelate aminotransferase
MDLPGNYLFADIARKVSAFREQNPATHIISLGIGDVTQPLAPAVVKALHKAADEMALASSFKGYGPERGYDFLREAIAANDYRARGIDIDPDEVFVSDGAKSDTGNFQELLPADCTVAVTDPVYPVYADSNLMAGRRIVKLPCTADNNFVPQLPKTHVDVIYLCYPNNPTGTVLTRQQLSRWVEYALANDAVIFYDAAYEAFIQDEDIPHSIYEIKGARQCAIEFRSYSKTAGFTGVRCGFTVVPKDICASSASGRQASLNNLWNRRQTTKFNGASYISQRAAEAIYTQEGSLQVRETLNYYMHNAHLMLTALRNLGYQAYGGENAPYIWTATPGGLSSWQFFELLLHKANIVCTPGAGFGPSGEGYVRFTAFNTRENTEKAMERIRAV